MTQVMKTLKLKLTGVSPVLLHSTQGLNPMSHYSKAMKEISSKRKKTDSDLEELAKIEFMSGLYLNEKHQVIIPSENLEAALVAGAKKTKSGQSAKAGLYISKESRLEFNGNDKTPDQLWKEGYYLQVPVRINNSKVIKTRPLFKDWSLVTEIEYHTELLSEKDVMQFAYDAGSQCGIGTWRPKYGRFTVEKLN